MCQGEAVYGQALHIAQAEAPTILEYYEAVASALNELPAAAEGAGGAAQQPYVVEIDAEDEVRAPPSELLRLPTGTA